MQCHAAHPQTDMTGLGLGFAVAGLLLANKKALKTFPVTGTYVLGPMFF